MWLGTPGCTDTLGNSHGGTHMGIDSWLVWLLGKESLEDLAKEDGREGAFS